MEAAVQTSEIKYAKAKRISLKKDAILNERWVQQRIAEDPSILGLGDLTLVHKELPVPSGGRLDLLLKDDDGWYAVEVQLGATDPSHIIRAIEYWDFVKEQNPGGDHFAVLVAEDVTHRFRNVLPHLSVPLVVIQMQALEVGAQRTLVFTTIENRSAHRNDTADTSGPADRAYWEKKASDALRIVDDVFALIQKSDANFQIGYNLNYIQINKAGRIFVWFGPRTAYTRIGVKMERTAESEELRAQLEAAGLEVQYSAVGKSGPSYRVIVNNDEFSKHASAIDSLISLALEPWNEGHPGL